MVKILINDGLDVAGKEKLLSAEFDLHTEKIPQEDLVHKIKEFDAILVRSATKVTSDIIKSGDKLKLIGRGGVGLDNIDVSCAEERGVRVINTPAASSVSVAELAFSHLFSAVRFLNESNRTMPAEGNSKFKDIKKAYSKGWELRGKTLGIIGFGRIGREVARIAIGVGMDILAYDLYPYTGEIHLEFSKHMTDAVLEVPVKSISKEEVLKNSDFITLHVPYQKGDEQVITKKEFDIMKTGVGIINCSRGGSINEDDLLEALNSGKVSFAGLDVFENEPTPRQDLLQHPIFRLPGQYP